MSLSFKIFDHKLELHSQRRLFIECFPETKNMDASSIEHYFWKFHSNFSSKKVHEYSAYLDSNLVGYYASLPFEYFYKGNFFNIAMVCDVMTGVNSRGLGIFSKLGSYSTNDLAVSGFDFSIGFPIRKEVIPGHLKVGWTINFKLPLFIRVLKFDTLLKKYKLGFFTFFLNKINLWLNQLFYKLKSKKNQIYSFEIYSNKQINLIQGLSVFYSTWKEEAGFRLNKDLNFLNWRLGGPNLDYHILIARKESKIVGALIGRRDVKNNVPFFGILDISVLKDNVGLASLLTDEIFKYSFNLNVDLLMFMMSKNNYLKHKLYKSLFFNSGHYFNFISKKFNSNLSSQEVFSEHNWDLMWIDSDVL